MAYKLQNSELVGFRNRAIYYGGQKVYPPLGTPLDITGYDRAYTLFSSLIPDTSVIKRFRKINEQKTSLNNRVAYSYYLTCNNNYVRNLIKHTEGDRMSLYVENVYRDDGHNRKFPILRTSVNSSELYDNNNILYRKEYHPSLNTKPSNSLFIISFKIYKDDSTNEFEKVVNLNELGISIRDSGIYAFSAQDSFENSTLINSTNTEGKVITLCCLHNLFKIEIEGIGVVDWIEKVLPKTFNSAINTNTSILIYEIGCYTTSGKSFAEAKHFTSDILARINNQLRFI